MFRRRRSAADADPLAHVDPAAAPRRFAPVVANAVEARRRYADVVAATRPGPVRDQLTAMAGRVDAGVVAVWEAVTRAGDLDRTLAALDPERVTHEYKDAKRRGDPELEAVHGQRFAAVQRLLNTLDDTDERLRLLQARLEAAVARAAEVALGTTADTADVSAELDDVVEGLAALRSGLDEVGST